MNIKILATSKQFHDTSTSTIHDELYTLAGKQAGICYSEDDYFSSKIQDEVAAIKRANMCSRLGHHSPFDHETITIQIMGIPKILAMVLNSTNFYTTSEKSARYTSMTAVDAVESQLYNKWLHVFEEEINKYSASIGIQISSKDANKLAMENARYMLSVFTPTSMSYTTSLRQFNYLIQWLDSLTTRLECNNTPFNNRLIHAVSELHDSLSNEMGDIASCDIFDGKNMGFHFLKMQYGKILNQFEYFGNVYSTSYKASFAQLAQIQRHRTLHYDMYFDGSNLESVQCYIPPILMDTPYESEWKNDFMNICEHFPQCMLVDVVEEGRFVDFILKTKERLCGRTQLETTIQTANTMEQFIKNRDNLSDDNKALLDECTRDNQVVPRCLFASFNCTDKCILGPILALSRKI